MATLPDEAKLTRYVKELAAWQNDLEPLVSLWKDLWDKYRIEIRQEPSDNKYRSAVDTHRGHHAVEVITPRIVGQQIEMRYTAQDTNQDAPTALMQTQLTNRQIITMGLQLELKNFVKQASVCNWTVAKFAWAQEYAKRTHTQSKRVYEPNLRGHVTVQEEVTRDILIRNEPFFETINIAAGDFVWPLTYARLNKCPAVWQRMWLPLGYLRKWDAAGIYHGVDEVRGSGTGTRAASLQPQFSDQGLGTPNDDLVPDDDDAALCEVWERWSSSDNSLYTLVGPSTGPVCIRDGANPFHHRRYPYVDYSLVPDPHQMPGISTIQVCFDMVEELNTHRRQQDDAVHFNVNPAMKTRGLIEFELFPGANIPVDDNKDVEPVFMPQVDLPGQERLMERILEDIRDLTGATSVLAGTPTAGASTATEIATLANEGGERVTEMREQLALRTMVPLGIMLASMNAQFYDGQNCPIDFSESPEMMAAWAQLHEMSDWEQTPQVPMGMVQMDGRWLASKGRLMPLPQVGQSADQSKLQRRSDAVQLPAALAPMLALQPLPFDAKAMVEYVLKGFDVPLEERQKILNNSAAVQQTLQTLMQSQQPTTSGPSGDNLPTGGVPGAPGLAGQNGAAVATNGAS